MERDGGGDHEKARNREIHRATNDRSSCREDGEAIEVRIEIQRVGKLGEAGYGDSKNANCKQIIPSSQGSSKL